MDPMTQTVVRYVLTWALTFIGTKTGIAAFADPSFVNVVMTAVLAVAAAGVGAWGISRSTTTAKVQDLAASPDIHSIHATPAVVAAAADPKVKAP